MHPHTTFTVRGSRHGVSLLETLVVLTLIAILAAMMLPAVQRVRAAANNTACKNNLRQLGIGIHLYYDANRKLPYPRKCPAPWRSGKDEFCSTCIPPNTYTGANESWWCPYDNRTGSRPTAGVAGMPAPVGEISPFVENSKRVFRCPDGVDRTPDSPTRGTAFQISYWLQPMIGGKSLSEVGRSVFIMEHDDLPDCRGPNDHFTDWRASPQDRLLRHEAKRHFGRANSVNYDGSIP